MDKMKRIIFLSAVLLFVTAFSPPVQAGLTIVSEYRSLVPGQSVRFYRPEPHLYAFYP